MTPSVPPLRALVRALAAAAALVTLVAPAAAATEPEAANFDARAVDAGPAPGARARAALRDRLGRFGTVSMDRRTGTARAVARLDGFLTGPGPRDGASVALDYVRDHAAALGLSAGDVDGLRLVDRDVVDGVEYLAWEQRFRGIPAADTGLRAAVTTTGRLLKVSGPAAAGLGVGSTEPRVTAADAYTAARAGAGDRKPAARRERRRAGAERDTGFADGGRAWLTLYRAGTGYRLAWRVLAPVSSTGVYDVLVDARSGAPVRRINRVKFAVPASVFPYNPAAGVQTSVDFAPWLTSTTALDGPNAHAFLDVHDVVGPKDDKYEILPESGSDVPPQGGGYQFGLTTVPNLPNDGCPGVSASFPSSACTWDPLTAGSWEANQSQSAAQLFYLVNTFHDHLRNDPDIGFVDGEFRRNPGVPMGDPSGQASAGASDPVLAQALDGADTAAGFPDAQHVNNADFLTLPDGYPGLMQTYLWRSPYGAYDGANDAAMVFHEYTHGFTDRTITDSEGYGALGSPQAGALSEGWSDYYALDYLVGQGLQADAPGTPDVRFGRYFDNATGQLVRNQSIDCDAASVSPSEACPAAPGPAGAGAFTYADFARIASGAVEVHDDGEIWAQTLWSLRSALVGRYGSASGAARARHYVTSGIRLSPPEPSFLDVRDGILQSAATSGGAADVDTLWAVFASRGMGWSAATTGGDDTAPTAAFDRPPRAETGAASSVGQTSATVAAVVDPVGSATDYRFEFGETPLLGTRTEAQPAGAAGPATVAAALTGLRPGTTYHYRVVALRGARELPGAVRTFVTAAATPKQTLPQPTATTLAKRAVSASRKGMFKVRLTFGSRAPAGQARLSVVARGRRLAVGRLTVRPGRTVIKTLRLNAAGRRTIKPGRSLKVKVQLRLPGGGTVERRVKLTRSRR